MQTFVAFLTANLDQMPPPTSFLNGHDLHITMIHGLRLANGVGNTVVSQPPGAGVDVRPWH